MKNYKDFDIISLGGSDGAVLSLVTDNSIDYLYFGEDGEYKAYFVNEEIELPSHYKKVFETTGFVGILDDDKSEVTIKADKIEIYRAGERGCLIYAPNGDYFYG